MVSWNRSLRFMVGCIPVAVRLAHRSPRHGSVNPQGYSLLHPENPARTASHTRERLLQDHLLVFVQSREHLGLDAVGDSQLHRKLPAAVLPLGIRDFN